jgi:hypothetical protein
MPAPNMIVSLVTMPVTWKDYTSKCGVQGIALYQKGADTNRYKGMKNFAKYFMGLGWNVV